MRVYPAGLSAGKGKNQVRGARANKRRPRSVFSRKIKRGRCGRFKINNIMIPSVIEDKKTVTMRDLWTCSSLSKMSDNSPWE